MPWGKIAGVLFLAYVSQLLPLSVIGNIRRFYGVTDPSILWSGQGALLVNTGLGLANVLALLLAVTAGQRYERRRLARGLFFAIAALGTPWAGAQLAMRGPWLASATFVMVVGSLIAGRLVPRS